MTWIKVHDPPADHGDQALTRLLGRETEVDGNRTRQTEILGLTGFEDRGDHQEPRHLHGQPTRMVPVARAIIAIPGKPTIVHRVGTVTEYTPGISITILAVDGNTYPFTFTADTRILPADRAVELAVGSRVTVIAPRDPGALSWTATGIVVHPATSQ